MNESEFFSMNESEFLFLSMNESEFNVYEY